MSTVNKSSQYSAAARMKWWYVPGLILGLVMIIGGIVWIIVQ
jgi:hypothetical protein